MRRRPEEKTHCCCAPLPLSLASPLPPALTLCLSADPAHRRALAQPAQPARCAVPPQRLGHGAADARRGARVGAPAAARWRQSVCDASRIAMMMMMMMMLGGAVGELSSAPPSAGEAGTGRRQARLSAQHVRASQACDRFRRGACPIACCTALPARPFTCNRSTDHDGGQRALNPIARAKVLPLI